MRTSSGFTISTSADSAMSAAMTGPAPLLMRRSCTGCEAKLFSRSFLMFRTICVTSSLTPGIVENSWYTSRIWIEVTAAPSRDDSRTRRRALPRVTPYPACSGPASYFAYVPASATGSICGVSSSIMRGGLPRVVLDHELLVEVERHLVAAGEGDHRAGHVAGVEAQPLRCLVLAKGLLHRLEQLSLLVRAPARDPVAHLEGVRRDVGRGAVHLEVAVSDDLPGGRARGREAEPEHDVVHPELERAEERLTGHAGVAGGLDEVVAELLLEDAVHAADLLLLAKLEAVIADLAAADAVLAGRRRAPLEGALLAVAAAALEVELHPLAAAEPADRICVTSHWSLRLRPGAAWAGGIRCAGWA